LRNYRFFAEQLNHEVLRTDQYDEPLSLVPHRLGVPSRRGFLYDVADHDADQPGGRLLLARADTG